MSAIFSDKNSNINGVASVSRGAMANCVYDAGESPESHSWAGRTFRFSRGEREY